MHTYTLTTKPPEGSGTFNALLGAVVAGRYYGETNSSLSFEDSAINASPESAPRGYNGAGYNVVPHMSAVDPTSMMSLGAEAAFRRNPVGTVGYTHDHVAVEMLSHISAKFARWLADFLVLYESAKLAQEAIAAGKFAKIDEEREVRYHEGAISEFLAAVGSLDDGNVSYPASRTIDVNVIFARVMKTFEANINIIDEIGYRVGEKEASRSIGTAVMPKSGIAVKVVSPSTYDSIVSHRWKRLLPLARSRDILRPVFEERLRCVIDAADPADTFVTITEGGESLLIPTQIGGQPTTWSSLTEAIDARPGLSTCYTLSGSAGSRTFDDVWTNQFYTQGELVRELLSGRLDPLAGDSILSVLLANPILDAGTTNVIVGPVTGSTGALSSYNLIQADVASPITGSINVIDGADSDADRVITFTPLITGSTDSVLPNGILEIGSCGQASAVDWMNILRHLQLNYPQRVKQLMLQSGRAKKSLPVKGNRLQAFDQLLSQVCANGQRDGYINMPSLAFNVTRNTRTEQEGPVSAGTFSATDGTVMVSPSFVSDMNGWDRMDSSDGRYFSDIDGNVYNLTGDTPSRFTGEWDAGRYAVWAADFAPDSIAAGSPNIEGRVALNLLSLPMSESASGDLTPRYAPTYTAGSSVAALHAVDVAERDEIDKYYVAIATQAQETGGYIGASKHESYHHTRGFMRGLALCLPDEVNIIGGAASYYGPNEAIGTDNRGRLVDSAGNDLTVTAIGSTNTPVYNALPASSAAFKVDVTGAAIRMAPGANWLWDPTRAQIFGTSWHRWSGTVFNDILPHPYAPFPVAVPTSVMRISDLVGVCLATETSCTAQLHGTATTGWNSLTGSAVTVTGVNNALANADTYGCPQVTAFTNAGSNWAAQVGSAISDDMSTNTNWDLLTPVQDTAAMIPAYDMIYSIRNGCQGDPFGESTIAGVAKGLDDVALSTLSGDTNSLRLAPTLLSGECFFPSVDTSPSSTHSQRTLEIRGKGLVFQGDTTTRIAMNPRSWFNFVYNGDMSLTDGPTPGYWGSFSVTNGIVGVAPSNAATNFTGLTGSSSPSYLQAFAVLKFGVDYSGVGSVSNNWFRKSADLSDRHARMRATMPNPWVRADNSPGFAHLRYDNSQIGPVFSSISAGMLSEGRSYQIGLTDTDFLSIQQFS